jgi:hypothetical protein
MHALIVRSFVPISYLFLVGWMAAGEQPASRLVLGRPRSHLRSAPERFYQTGLATRPSDVFGHAFKLHFRICCELQPCGSVQATCNCGVQLRDSAAGMIGDFA